MLVGATDFLDHAVGAESLEQAGDCPWRAVREQRLEVAVLEPGKKKLAADDSLEERQVGSGEEVEAGVGPSAIVSALGEFVEVLEPRARVVETGEVVDQRQRGRGAGERPTRRVCLGYS